MNRFLAITLAAAVAGCVSHTPTDAISDDELDPTTFYIPGTWTPLDAGVQVITFSLSDYWLKTNTDSPNGTVRGTDTADTGARQQGAGTDDQFLRNAWEHGSTAERQFGMAPGQGLVPTVQAEDFGGSNVSGFGQEAATTQRP
jgi:hypothetical protein